MAEIAATASDVLHRKVRHSTVSDEEWIELKMQSGTPRVYAEMLLGTFRAARRGDFAATDPTLGTLLGREPLSIGTVMERHEGGGGG
ncbi:hypothetical protein [Aurantimonas sp. VKM B-3413]|uniref:hypothetical protein n=1 Tax=Aurantimonas sp. VKM B-3413 TaxID=2779401 RepID=UPI001E3798C6|nr:hypothetical protein [Aurantimonas sp. VKM B-3413]MCB8839742.1 hypothetical protein [Aurantimonas sp. VKM B-3413]